MTTMMSQETTGSGATVDMYDGWRACEKKTPSNRVLKPCWLYIVPHENRGGEHLGRLVILFRDHYVAHLVYARVTFLMRFVC